MSEMTERIASAMWDRCREQPQMPMFAHEHEWSDVWPEAFEWMRDMIREQARAAIQAMRDPPPPVSTAVMIAAGKVADIHDGEVYISADAGRFIVGAMIDQAIKEAEA